ncbi:hypothetical protein BC829DRAFT_381610 [Chytridium lagenaria]|nr:hypothetical protein BC829DRAFT_381610 [Chytridium lagenaria]
MHQITLLEPLEGLGNNNNRPIGKHGQGAGATNVTRLLVIPVSVPERLPLTAGLVVVAKGRVLKGDQGVGAGGLDGSGGGDGEGGGVDGEHLVSIGEDVTGGKETTRSGVNAENVGGEGDGEVGDESTGEAELEDTVVAGVGDKDGVGEGLDAGGAEGFLVEDGVVANVEGAVSGPDVNGLGELNEHDDHKLTGRSVFRVLHGNTVVPSKVDLSVSSRGNGGRVGIVGRVVGPGSLPLVNKRNLVLNLEGDRDGEDLGTAQDGNADLKAVVTVGNLSRVEGVVEVVLVSKSDPLLGLVNARAGKPRLKLLEKLNTVANKASAVAGNSVGGLEALDKVLLVVVEPEGGGGNGLVLDGVAEVGGDV